MVNSKGRPPVEWGRGAVTEVPKVIVESCLDIHEGLTYKMRLIYFFFFFFSKTGCVKGAGVSSGLRALQSFTMTPFPKYPNEHHQSLTMLECHSLLRLLGLFLKLSLWHYGENYTFSTFWSITTLFKPHHLMAISFFCKFICFLLLCLTRTFKLELQPATVQIYFWIWQKYA